MNKPMEKREIEAGVHREHLPVDGQVPGTALVQDKAICKDRYMGIYNLG